MKRLDVDIGNSRTKWRFGGVRGTAPGVLPPALEDVPDRVCIACVAAARDEILTRFEAAFGVRPEFAETVPELAGVTCGYENPALLGVDRWLALVAAWNMVRRPAVVADLGTAVTLDFVTGDGRHVGGYIVPGPGMMAKALARDTALVRVTGDLARDLLPGRDTSQAVRRGTTAMLVSFIEWSVAQFSRGESPVVFLTGGDAENVAGGLSLPVRVEPDLVFDGLALALP